MTELLWSILDREPVGIAVMVPDGGSIMLAYVNATLAALMPLSLRSGRRLDEVWPDLREFLPAVARVLETGEPVRAENLPLEVQTSSGDHPTRHYTCELSRLEIGGRRYVLALVSEAMAEAEQEAGEHATYELESTRQILAGARTLAGTLELPEVLGHIVKSLLAATNLGRVLLNLWNDDRSEFVVAASAGRGKADLGLTFSFRHLSETTHAAITGRRTVVVDYDPLPAEQKRYPLELQMRQALFVPLIERGEFVGFVSLDDPGDRHEFTAYEKEVAEGIAAQAATAIMNAQLVENVRERARLERSMAEITAELASSLDIDDTLPRVLGRLCTELSCRGAAVDDRVSGGWRMRNVVGFEDSPVEAGGLLSDKEAPSGHEVVHPLIVRGEVTGRLSVFFSEPQTLSPGELDYLQRIAFATSLAEENSRLYKAEHRIAETLQTALLALPERLPGVEFAHLYRSATETARVGGDFYDLFAVEHNRVAITVGDISGHGVDAAVQTSLVKNAIRAQTMQGDLKPNEVMATTSRLLYQNSATEIFATVFFGILNLDDGQFEYCNAGHPPGALLGARGGVRRLSGNGPLIGALDNEDFGLSFETVEPGDVLFLYTDGLTEACHDHERFGDERLFALLERERDSQPESTLQHVSEEVLDFARGQLTDDLAILTLQRS